jgi:hypothetical protein
VSSRGVLLAVALGVGCSSAPRIVEAVGAPDSDRLGLVVDTCNADLAVTIGESTERVTVTITARGDTSDDCLDSVTLQLDAPLGDRVVVDGASGEVVPVRSGTG